MRVYVHGTGARDHCLAEEYAESYYTEKPVHLLGLDGIEEYTKKGLEGWIKTHPELKKAIDKKGLDAVVDFCIKEKIDLVDVGSENPLDEGLVDKLTAAGIPVIGPKKEYVKIENDREWTNQILTELGVKPEWRVFDPGLNASESKRKDVAEAAKKYVRDVGYRVVVKAGGLAAGKGSFVCNNPRDAAEAIDRIILAKEFEKHGPNSLKAIVEARMPHEEFSFFVYCDGKTFLPLKMFAQDYKPAYDPNDILGMFYYHYGRNVSDIRRGLQENKIKIPGNLEKMSEDERSKTLASILKERNVRLVNPNTGGTGCYCPHRLVSEELTDRIIREIVKPFVEKIYEGGEDFRGMDYKGVLYFAINLNPDNSLSVFEVNVRHGDPEWEVIARKLGGEKTDLFEIAWSTWRGKLDNLKRNLPNGELEWNPRHYVDVVAMTGPAKAEDGWYQGYPGRYGKGYRIEGLDKIHPNVAIFFSGTSWKGEGENRQLVTDGGRVLHVVAGGSTLEEATDLAYRNIERIAFLDTEDNNVIRYRKRIGSREVD